MGIELYEHNKEAYDKVIKSFEEDNKCCIIHPTGSGKSYIALKWLNDNKDKKSLIVTSSLAIISHFERIIRENNMSLEKDFPDLKIITYSALMKNPHQSYDNIVLDEFHRAGADKWGKAVNTLLDTNSNARVLGMSATPVRYLDNKRDMSSELFEGNVASHITLPYAIATGILPPPTYINAIYSFKDDIDNLEKKISNIKDKNEKDMLEVELKKAKRLIEEADNLSEVFEKYMTKSDGKYLVFCRDIKHLENMVKEAHNWFLNINDNIDISYIHSEEEHEMNKYTLDRFYNIKGNGLKLLYSVGMLNEGMHVEDIDGVIMLRPTSSPILYMQQLGRALTTGVDGKPLVFDVVNNIKCLKDIEFLRDAVIKVMHCKGKSKKEIDNMIRSFSIIDDYKNIVDLIEELEINATYGWNENYEKLKKFYEEHKRFPTRTEECGVWLHTQREKAKNKKGKNNLSKERCQKLEEINKDWSNDVYEKNWNENYEKLKKFYEEHKRFPTKTEECGKWLNNQRQKTKNKKGKNSLSEEQLKKLEEIDKDWIDGRKKVVSIVNKSNEVNAIKRKG